MPNSSGRHCLPNYYNKLKENKLVEIVGARIKSDNGVINVASCYIPPKATLADYEALEMLDKAKTIIGGDFNCHTKLWDVNKENSKGKKLV